MSFTRKLLYHQPDLRIPTEQAIPVIKANGKTSQIHKTTQTKMFLKIGEAEKIGKLLFLHRSYRVQLHPLKSGLIG